jgi:iron complex outermembrane receptor protein
MKQLVKLLWLLWLCPGMLQGQQTYSLSASVRSAQGLPLSGASVMLLPLAKGTISDAQGRFSYPDLPYGDYTLEVSYLGYAPWKGMIFLLNDSVLDIRMQPVFKTLQEVVIHDDYAEMRRQESILNVEVAGRDYLRQHLGGSLVQSLERLPGFQSLDIGSGQARPAIRGLGLNRVLVLENGVAHQAQQWGGDHGLELDQYAVDKLEVVKGPMSVMYGGDAIGGVLDARQAGPPPAGSAGGSADFSGATANGLFSTSLMAYVRKKDAFLRIRTGGTSYGDMRVPADSADLYSYRIALPEKRLRNTAGREWNMHLAAGLVREKSRHTLYLSRIHQKSGFFANAHGLEPRRVDEALHDQSNRDIQMPSQEVSHTKLISEHIWQYGDDKLELVMAWQHNLRHEYSDYVSHGFMPDNFPGNMPFPAELERGFMKDTWTGQVSYQAEMAAGLQLRAGFNAERQDNRIDGRGFLIPSFTRHTAGTWAYAGWKAGQKHLVQLGMRFDYAHLHSQAYYDWFPSMLLMGSDTQWVRIERAEALTRDFQQLSWSLGYRYQTETWSVSTNVGRGFRFPIAKELAANGVNYHHFSYEVGDPGLDPEVSYQWDAGIHYHHPRLAVGLTPFLNYFSNYIYLLPTAAHDRLYGNGNQVFNYTGAKVLRWGGELHAHYDLFAQLTLGGIIEYVYAEQLDGPAKGFGLPFTPPALMILNLKYKPERLAGLNAPYLSLDFRKAARQGRIVPPEESTPAYHRVDFGVGGWMHTGLISAHINIQLKNVLNTAYFNHSSYYRLIGLPEQGRSLWLNVSIPFQGKLKTNLSNN